MSNENNQVTSEPQFNNQASVNNEKEMSSIETLLKKSFEIYKANFWKFMALMFIIVGVVIGLMIVFVLPFAIVGDNFSKNLLTISLIVILLLLFIVTIFILALIVQTAFYILIRDSAKNPSIKELLLEGKKNALNIFWLGLLQGIILLFWFLLFIIPGIIFTIYYSVAIWVYIYENKKGKEALDRSKELVEGHWWAVFGRFVFLWVFVVLLSLIPVLGPIINFLSGPFFTIYSCFIYWDLVRLKSNTLK